MSYRTPYGAVTLVMMAELPSKIGMYHVVRQLGEGGMGTVFEAIHEAIERRVAIKVLHPKHARNAEFTARFFNEARAVNRVAHPGLVQISDFGQQPDGTSYIVMEFLEGESLGQRLYRLGGKLSSSDVIHLGGQLADSLAAAHEKGIVHRDLKPDNVMVVPDPQMTSGERTKLLDFGIAKVAEPGGSQRPHTRTGQVLGTPTYMSPEQCSGGSGVDEKSDVYSLGVMLFEMLAGRPPFCAEEDGSILAMHMLVAPPLLRQLVPDIPSPLEDLVQRLLAKNKEARPSMRQVAAILERLAEQQPPPKRSASNQTLRPADIALPDETIIELPNETIYVGHKKPQRSTLGSSAAQTLQRGPRLSRGKLAFCGALCVAGIMIFIISRSTNRTNNAPVLKNAVVARPLAVVEKRVTFRIDSEPPGAQVLRALDGQVLGYTPWQVTQLATEGRLQLRLRLNNHEEQRLSLATNQDQHAVVHLLLNRRTPTGALSGAGGKRRADPPKPSKLKTGLRLDSKGRLLLVD